MSGPPRVTVVGLGPAGPELMTAASVAAIESAPVRFLRTTRHPAAVVLTGAPSFDHHYETAATLEDVYAAIVEDLVAAARSHGRAIYAVPGSPAVAERTVELLRADPRVEIEVLPALSCVDLAWVRLGVDPLRAGVRIVDGHRFETEAAGERGPLLVLQCDRPEILAGIKLAIDDGPPVTVLQRLGGPDEHIQTIPWHELDRIVVDHLTALWIPELAHPVGRELVALAEVVRILREQCPWDREQTHHSLRRYLVEETYEVVDAIDSLDALTLGDSLDGFAALEEELGDLLFQVYFHATLASEEGQFTLADVARGIHDKLVRRHPHVFGDVDAATAEQVATNWDALKRQEKAGASAMDGVPSALPSLAYAQKVQRKAASVGFDWPDVDGAWPKIPEEIDEVRAAVAAGDRPAVEAEIGDLLFACVNVARHLGVDAEGALRQATAKFAARFREVERLAGAAGLSLPGADLAVLDGLWEDVKARSDGPGGP